MKVDDISMTDPFDDINLFQDQIFLKFVNALQVNNFDCVLVGRALFDAFVDL